MTNVFEQAITKEDGTVDFMKLATLAPVGMEFDPQYIMPHTMSLVAQTKLSADFMRKNFHYIPFGTLIIHNDVPQDIIEDNIEGVFAKLIFDFGSDEGTDRLHAFFQQRYEPKVYEHIIGNFFTYFAQNELPHISEDDIEFFSHMINGYSEIVSKEFIIKHTHDAGYLLFTAALKHGYFTLKELLDNLDLITDEELWAWHEQFDENELEEEGIYTLDNRNMLYTLISVKASHRIIE